MARRNKSSSGVRGPNSALTEFLRTEGITEAFRQRRERQQRNEEQGESEDIEDRNISNVQEISENDVSSSESATGRRNVRSQTEEESDEESQIRAAGRKKRRAARRNRGGNGFPSDSDDDYDDDYEGNISDDDLNADSFKKFGEEDSCVECGETFHLTVYSRYIREKRGYLCESCNEVLKQKERLARKNQLNARKKRKKVAQALLDKTVVKIPTLQDICIKKITDNINDVDVLGDIGQMNLNKISKILSKNRSLNDSTMTLFLSPELKSLEFWDCSNVDSDSLNKIASYCSNLESLTLFMCGQLHNDNLKYFSSNLKSLSHLALDGPFLISEVAWQEYFETSGSSLQSFEIRNTHRFSNDSFISLLENAGANLKLLKLSRLDGVDAASVYELLPHYIQSNKLHALELSYPLSEELISDDLIINILSVTGESLRHLTLDGCTQLTDRFLLEGLVKFCPNLTHLSLNYLDQLTNDGFFRAFEDYGNTNTGGLIDVKLVKCTGLGDNGIYSLLKHSCATLVELNLNGIHSISHDFIFQVFTSDSHPVKIATRKKIESGNEQLNNTVDKPLEFFEKLDFPLLTAMDIGFVRAFDNEILELVSRECEKLGILEVFGDNKCTSRAKVPPGLIVIGRQSDII
ncbi:uncharacterized protein PRCAT00001355001 [Priceomyces carsonii]|uniref:uncharacterized protein n=1 Tax=Priceomyces carsonii TaxID=28549 RepID=UPI002ED95255|nr:unnamed protein product [Priceomyces carsonii]